MSSKKYKVAVIDDWSIIAEDCGNWDLLKPICQIDFYYDNINDVQANVNRLKPYDIIVCNRNRTKLGQQLLSQLPNLKLIASTGPGNKVIDLGYTNKHNITVCMTDHPGYGNLKNEETPTAQLVWAYILEYYRNIHVISSDLKHNVNSWYPIGLSAQPESLSNKVLGVIGLGNIGHTVARVAILFGLNVIAWSFHLTQQRCNVVNQNILCCNSLNELLKKSDIIVISMPLSETTKYLINKNNLKLIKKDSLLINVSRGDLIKENDLINVLKNKEIGGVGLDVFHEEPLPSNHSFRVLYRNNNKIMISAHQGGFVKQAYQLWYRNCIENILAFINNTPIRVVNPSQFIVKADKNELKIASVLYNRSKL